MRPTPAPDKSRKPTLAIVSMYNPLEVIRGGIEQYVLSLSTALAKAGARIIIVTMGDQSLPSESGVDNVTYRVISDSGFKNKVFRALLFGLRGATCLEFLTEGLGVDCYIGQAGFASPLVMAYFRGARVVLTVHTGEEHNTKVDFMNLRSPGSFAALVSLLALPILRLWRLLYLTSSSGLVFVSPAARQETNRYYPVVSSKPNVLIPVGVEVGRNESSWPRLLTHDLIFVGRLEMVKGADLLLEALQRLSNTETLPRVCVVGSGSLLSQFIEFSRKAKAFERITLLRNLDRASLLGLISSARYLVVPSRIESDPAVVREALSVGTPVLAFDIPSLRSLYPANLVTYGGTPSADNLTDLIRGALSESSSEYQDRVDTIHHAVEGMAEWSTVAERYLEFIDKLPDRLNTLGGS